MSLPTLLTYRIIHSLWGCSKFRFVDRRFPLARSKIPTQFSFIYLLNAFQQRICYATYYLNLILIKHLPISKYRERFCLVGQVVTLEIFSSTTSWLILQSPSDWSLCQHSSTIHSEFIPRLDRYVKLYAIWVCARNFWFLHHASLFEEHYRVSFLNNHLCRQMLLNRASSEVLFFNKLCFW